MKRQWYYRGSLKSCNYRCGYCPFSKKKESADMLKEDKEALFRFVEEVNRCGKIQGALQIVPYGEALIHEYYWEGLAALSRNPGLDAVGAQSNFSFPVDQMLAVYCAHGGKAEKLRLWGTFHPEMVSREQFLKQCSRLDAWKISYCAGAVGVPAHLTDILQLRRKLPSSVYFWINKMDGMGRPYTESERKAFTEIDGYFELELMHHKADSALCGDNRFVEADGTMHRCNICRQAVGNFYDRTVAGTIDSIESKKCSRKECSCYLSYCNRQEERLLFFRPYPAFRIPVYPKAVFMDIDGTLIPKGQKQIPDRYIRQLYHLSHHSSLYFATSLPFEIARIKAGTLWPVMRGGVFAGGARCMIRGEEGVSMDEVRQLETCWLAQANENASRYGYHVHVYKKGGCIYKVTLADKKNRQREKDKDKNLNQLKLAFGIPDSCQLMQEENCIQITKRGVGKLQGVLQICKKMGYAAEDVAVFGDSVNDIPLFMHFPFSVAAKGSCEKVQESAGYYFP